MSPDKILVIDDDSDQRRALAGVLSGLAPVLEAADGRAGLALLDAEHPRLVLLDATMPGLDGMEVLRRIRKSSPSTLVVMLTGRDDLELACSALDAGAAQFITKPFDPDGLRAEVSRMLEAEHIARDEKPWRVVG
jgi:DNA-binding response OmpR family regulator